ncbi:nuclear transport factor 2 family protein [Dongia sp.]|uniref:nuclear transport factor 2 family protein n=1 Tax=Dongia sp. TaxID=1977262 RepID=UPI0037523FF9
MEKNPIAVAHAAYQAYVEKDRAAMEALVAADYRFTSPLDNGLDRATYFDRCWPNSAQFSSFDLVQAIGEGEHVFIVYEAQTKTGKRFRNCEFHTVRDGKLVSTEVYFGWDLPHKAEPGGYVLRM